MTHHRTTSILSSQSPSPKRLALRPREAAEALGVSERSLWTLTNDGTIPCVRVGRIILYPVDALETWLANAAEHADGSEVRDGL